MAKIPRIQLTDERISTLATPATGQTFHWDSVRPGLGVRVTAAGSRTYVAQGQCNGKTVRVTLDACERLTIDSARAQARAAIELMRSGTNPAERKKAEKVKDITLQEVLDDYVSNRRSAFGPLRESTVEKYREHVTRYLSDWAPKPIGKITHLMVAARFRKISDHAPVQANIIMGTLRALCSWASSKSIGADGVPTLLPFNPVVTAFKTLARYNHVKPKTRRIPTDKTGACWSLLQGRMDLASHTPNDVQNAALLLSLMLTGARFNEMAQLKWDAVFMDAADPYLQFVETKMHRTLKLPLTKQLLAILRLQWERRETSVLYVFVGRTRKTHIKTPYQTLMHVGTAAGCKISAHDLRRGYIQAGHTLGIQKHILDVLSGHIGGDVTIRHYTETEDLRCYRAEAQRIADWFEQAGATYDAQQSGANVIQLSA